jgi:hypothetical protein
MALDDVTGNGQSQSCTALGAGAVLFIESLEDPDLLVLWYARPGILHAEEHILLTMRLRTNGNCTALRGKLDCVVDKIADGAPHLLARRG